MLWFSSGPDCCRLSYSGMEVLQYGDVSYEMLASCYPKILSPYMEFAERLKIEGDQGFVHMYMDIFTNIAFSLQFGFSPTNKQIFRALKTEL